MEVTQNFTCECNGHMYKNKSGLAQHKKSAAHQSWETVRELKDERCRRTLLENQNAMLKKEISDLKDELRRVYRRVIYDDAQPD
jgi:hypothetical protein